MLGPTPTGYIDGGREWGPGSGLLGFIYLANLCCSYFCVISWILLRINLHLNHPSRSPLKPRADLSLITVACVCPNGGPAGHLLDHLVGYMDRLCTKIEFTFSALQHSVMNRISFRWHQHLLLNSSREGQDVTHVRHDAGVGHNISPFRHKIECVRVRQAKSIIHTSYLIPHGNGTFVLWVK